MIVYKHFTFDAAHALPKVPYGHKCRSLHGHTYHLTVYVAGPVEIDTGWVIDFNEIKTACQPVIEQLDHTYLNDIQGLENPTAEILAAWIWQRLKKNLKGLKKIELKETPTSGVICEGESS